MEEGSQCSVRSPAPEAWMSWGLHAQERGHQGCPRTQAGCHSSTSGEGVLEDVGWHLCLGGLREDREDTQHDTRRAVPSPLCLLPQEECQNYVRVLIVTGRKVFMCGTNAFSPVCSSRQVGSPGRAGRQKVCHPGTQPGDGVAKYNRRKPNPKLKLERIPRLIRISGIL